MGNDKTKASGSAKLVALITYSLALVCLLLGLFLPLGNIPGAEGKSAIMAFQLPQAINAIVSIEALGGVGEAFTYSYPAFGGWIEGGIDLGAIFVLLYALVTLAGIVGLIPAIVNAASKKSRKNIALNVASFIEVLALIFLSALVAIQLTMKSLGAWAWSWSLVIAFGGTLLFLIIQAFASKKGSGVVKFILALLSAVAVLTCVYDITLIIPPLADVMGQIPGGMPQTLYSNVIGLSPAMMLFSGEVALPEGAMAATVYCLAMIAALLVIINFVLDVMGLGKRTNTFMRIANVVRYGLELIAAALLIILPCCTEELTLGLYSIVLTVLAAVAFVINLIRLLTAKKRMKKAAAKRANVVVATEAKEEETAPVETKKERKAREKAERQAAKEAKKAAKEVKAAPAEEETETAAVAEQAPATPYSEDAEGNVVYKPIIYSGPTDDFIRTLSNEQKLEFARVFLERQSAALTCIPDYNVGGKNDKFFSSVFIYYGRVRDYISDGLMNEIYKQVNLMK